MSIGFLKCIIDGWFCSFCHSFGISSLLYPSLCSTSRASDSQILKIYPKPVITIKTLMCLQAVIVRHWVKTALKTTKYMKQEAMRNLSSFNALINRRHHLYRLEDFPMIWTTIMVRTKISNHIRKAVMEVANTAWEPEGLASLTKMGDFLC